VRHLSLSEALELHRRIAAQSGGIAGLRDIGALESALAQPRMSFGAKELYPTLIEKASALGFSLIRNHPFVDGNKRLGHAAMETFLLLNGYEIRASVEEQEQTILEVARGERGRGELSAWLREHVVEIKH
jgi:death on curing protein